jgi:predicted O-methyltransferase YrrM
MVTALQPDCVIETGACVGNTSFAIGRALRANGHGELVTLEVDPGHAKIARRKCKGLPVSVLELSSIDYVPTQPIDFAFFDSLARLRRREFERFLPWMHVRTIVAFHDTGPHHPVRRYLRPLEKAGLLLSPLYLPTPRGIMMARVGLT